MFDLITKNWLKNAKRNELEAKIIHLDRLVLQNANITLNETECKSDALMICSIFQTFPNFYNETKNFLSFLAFPPPIDGLPSRYFVYFKSKEIIVYNLFDFHNKIAIIMKRIS